MPKDKAYRGLALMRDMLMGKMWKDIDGSRVGYQGPEKQFFLRNVRPIIVANSPHYLEVVKPAERFPRSPYLQNALTNRRRRGNLPYEKLSESAAGNCFLICLGSSGRESSQRNWR